MSDAERSRFALQFVDLQRKVDATIPINDDPSLGMIKRALKLKIMKTTNV